jgi:molecular chaperone GrpE
VKDKKTEKKLEISEIDKLKKELETNVNDLKRLQADFENYKKRVEKENLEFKEYCNKQVLLDLLTLMDDLDHCNNGMKNASKEDLEKTFHIFQNKIKNLLDHYHVRSFNSLNEKFDPFKHEVLQQEESDKDDIVTAEFQKGYLYKDKMLRHAKVKVSRLKKGEFNGEKTNEETENE